MIINNPKPYAMKKILYVKFCFLFISAMLLNVSCSKDSEPVLKTSNVSNITKSTVAAGGDITSDEGSEVTARGVCWGTSSGPTVDNNKTTDGSGTGTFTSQVTGLSPNTTYYLRAYATNDAGTAYGDEVIFTTAPANVGESYNGGVVAYIFQPSDPGYSTTSSKGLIVASTDTDPGEWGCVGVGISTATSLGSGKQNTQRIIDNCSQSGISARLCDAYESGGYSDWFLPSKDELEKIYEARDIIGNLSNVNYWSSSQVNENFSWMHSFANGYQGDNHRSNSLRARPVRYF